MFGDASDLVAFRLMPLGPKISKNRFSRKWSFTVADMSKRLVSVPVIDPPGKLKAGTGNLETAQAQLSKIRFTPMRAHGEDFTVILDIEGAAGKSRRTEESLGGGSGM